MEGRSSKSDLGTYRVWGKVEEKELEIPFTQHRLEKRAALGIAGGRMC